MPIITKPAVLKGTPASFALSKATLASSITDTYFQDITNWKSVALVYKSAVGNQTKTVVFDASLASPLANLELSAKARDGFNIQSIIISDFDGGSHVIARAALTAAEFDVVIAAVADYVRDFVALQSLQTNETKHANATFTAQGLQFALPNNFGQITFQKAAFVPSVAFGDFLDVEVEFVAPSTHFNSRITAQFASASSAFTPMNSLLAGNKLQLPMMARAGSGLPGLFFSLVNNSGVADSVTIKKITADHKPRNLILKETRNFATGLVAGAIETVPVDPDGPGPAVGGPWSISGGKLRATKPSGGMMPTEAENYKYDPAFAVEAGKKYFVRLVGYTTDQTMNHPAGLLGTMQADANTGSSYPAPLEFIFNPGSSQVFSLQLSSGMSTTNLSLDRIEIYELAY